MGNDMMQIAEALIDAEADPSATGVRIGIADEPRIGQGFSKMIPSLALGLLTVRNLSNCTGTPLVKRIFFVIETAMYKGGRH